MIASDSKLLNHLTLLAIADFAEKLDIPIGVAATFRNGDDVVVLQFFLVATLKALSLIALPSGLKTRFGIVLRAIGWPPFRMPSALALELGHTSTALIFSSYRKVVAPEATHALLECRPQALYY